MNNGPGDGHALLFAATQFAGSMGGPLREPHALDRFGGKAVPLRAIDTLESQRQGDIFRGREAGDEVIRLENEPDRGSPVEGPLLPAHARQIAVIDPDTTGIGSIQTAQEVQQSRFP